MAGYIGTLGQLIPVGCPSDEASTANVRQATRELPSGGLVAFEAPKARREWDISTNTMTPAELAGWQMIARRLPTKPPYFWLSTYATTTNALPPDASLCATDSISWSGMSTNTPLSLPDGTVAYSSAVVLTPDASLGLPYNRIKNAYDGVPVVPGVKVTASAYCASSFASPVTQRFMTVQFFTATGTLLRADRADIPAGATITRVAIEGVLPPIGAAYCTLFFQNASQVANPAVTFTEKVQPWGIGDGCVSATVSGFSRSLLSAHSSRVYLSSSIKVIELEV